MIRALIVEKYYNSSNLQTKKTMQPTWRETKEAKDQENSFESPPKTKLMAQEAPMCRPLFLCAWGT